MRFSKWDALGNTYLVVEGEDAEALDAQAVRKACAVGTGPGADGVLQVTSVEEDTVTVVIWNPDGSTAEFSGNGTRIAARWLMRETRQERVRVVVGDRAYVAHAERGDRARMNVGAVVVGETETIDVDGQSVEMTPVDVGNPHAVITGVPVDRDTLLRLGPTVETHPRFPNRTNVQLVEVVGTYDVRALVWERGAGETSSSGSSAVAIAAAAVAREWCESPVTVHLPGGDLTVTIDADGHATLTGPAVEVETGEIG